MVRTRAYFINKFIPNYKPTQADYQDIFETYMAKGVDEEGLYIASGDGLKGDPMIGTVDGKVRKMVNKASISSFVRTDITGTPIIFGNTLNSTHGIIVVANKDDATPANNFVKVALVYSYTGQVDAPFGDKLHASMGASVTLAGTIDNGTMTKRPVYQRLSTTSFYIIAQTAAGAACYVYNIEIVNEETTIILDKTFAVDAVLLDIPSRAIVDEGGTTVDNIYFFAWTTGQPNDFIQAYKLTISTEILITFTPVELSCKVAHYDTIPFKCTQGMSGPGNVYAAFNRSVDNVIIVANITEVLNPVSITVVEEVQTETTDVTEFFLLNATAWVLLSAQLNQYNNNSYNFLSYTYDPTQNDLGREERWGDFLFGELLIEKRYDVVTTRILINHNFSEIQNGAEGIWSVSTGLYWYSNGMMNQFMPGSNQTSLFRLLNEISIVSLSDRLLVIDYEDASGWYIHVKTFNQNIEYVTDGVDEGFQFMGFAQTDYTDGALVKLGGVARFSEAHSGLLPGFMYYLRMDGTLMSFQPTWDLVIYCYTNFYPANITSRSINVFYAITENKLIQADIKGFVNSNYIDFLDKAIVKFVGR